MKTRIYRTYRFIDKDPMIDALRAVAQEEKIDPQKGHQISGLAAATIDNWFNGDTRRPQNVTSTAFAASLGYVRRDVMRPDGTVDVAYAKARSLDYKKEIEKQADFFLKNHGPKKKKAAKKAKANGHRRPNGHANGHAARQ